MIILTKPYFKYGSNLFSYVLIAFFLNSSALATTYYVSDSNGNDSNTSIQAQNINTPWKTIQRAADVMAAGDTCMIREGVYRETVTPANTGTSGSPIEFTPYSDESVTVNGCELISNWTLYQGNIYKASMSWTMGKGKDEIFDHGRVVVQARHPHVNTIDLSQKIRLSPLFPVFGNMTAVYSTSQISSDTDLNQTANYWTGAIYNGGHGWNWSWQSGIVESSDNGILNITDKTSQWWFNLLNQNKFPENQKGLLTDHINCLDYPGAWQREDDGYLYYWTVNSDTPSTSIEAKKRFLAFDLRNKDYIEITGLKIFASSISMYNANNCKVEKCLISYPSHYLHWDDSRDGYIEDAYGTHDNSFSLQRGEVGVFVGGDNNTICDSTIRYSAGAGIILAGKNSIIRNNRIHDCGYSCTYLGGIFITYNPEETASDERGGHSILYNDIYNIGRSAIHWSSIPQIHTPFLSSEVAYNRIHDAGLLSCDVGNIYGYNVSLDADGTDTEIHHNLIYNCWANYWGSLCMGDNYTYGAAFNNNILWKEPNSDRVNQLNDGFTHNNTPSEWTYSDNIKREDFSSGYNGLLSFDYPLGKVFQTGSDHKENPLENNYIKIEAEDCSDSDGIIIRTNNIGSGDSGDWIKFDDIDFGDGYSQLTTNIAVDDSYAGKKIEVRLDSNDGQLVGILTIEGTGGWSSYEEQTILLAGAYGRHDIYFCFTGGYGAGNIDWFKFTPSEIPFMQAEAYNSMSGIYCRSTDIGSCDNGDWVRYDNVNFGTGYGKMVANVAVADSYSGQEVEVRLDSATGTLLGTLILQGTGGWTSYEEQAVNLTKATGRHNVYFCFNGSTGAGNFDWFKFTEPILAPILQAENCSAQNGVNVNTTNISSCDDDDWIQFKDVNLEQNYSRLIVNLAVDNAYAGQQIEVRLDSTNGDLIGTLTTTGTDGWSSFKEQEITITGTSGIHDVFFCFKGSYGVGNFDYFKFSD